MTLQRRLERLEGIHRPEKERVTFVRVVPPEGLTREAEEQWWAEHRRECEARGVPVFTLDLAGCGTGMRGEDL